MFSMLAIEFRNKIKYNVRVKCCTAAAAAKPNPTLPAPGSGNWNVKRLTRFVVDAFGIASCEL